MVAHFRHFSLFLFLLFSSSVAHSQTDSVALADEYFKLGMEVFDYEHRAQAKDLFVLATSINPNNARAQFMAGQSIMLTVNKELSLPYFRKAWELDPTVDEKILFFLGQGYHHNYKFDSAILFYDRYNRILARSLQFDKSNKINEVNRKIFECRNAVIYLEHPVDVSITHLSSKINSEFPDYAPTLNADETLMVFTSRRPEDNSNASVAADLVYYEDIYYSEFKDGQWTSSKNMRGPLNTSYHNSSVAISPDGKEMVLYQDGNGGDLFISTKNQDNTWSKPKPMDGVNSEYLENSASLTSDNKTIYFTSNRPGGYGGTDIYLAELIKGRWTNVTNLGPLINTEMDEDGVFISANRKHLYFSSNGHAGMGDMDLYRTRRDSVNGAWIEPTNLGYPINSPENDIYFVLNEDESTAYISSVRKENVGEQDIYKVDMRNWKPIDIKQLNYSELFAESSSIVLSKEDLPVKQVAETKVVAQAAAASEANIKLFVEDAITLQKLNAQVFLRSKDGSRHDLNVTEEGVYTATLPTKSDNASVYKLEINSIGYAPQTATLYLGGITSASMTISDTIRMQKVAINVPTLIDIYFAHDSDEPLSFNGISDFIAMMQNSPSMRIEIGGHTDSLGPDEYNQILSQRRAAAVKMYLTKLGVDGSRVSAVGYGESRPVAANDSQEGRRLNRRTEFIILQK